MAALVNNIAIRAVFAQPLPDGSFERPIREFLRSVGGRQPILLLAFAPKCAGTYFPEAAIQALKGRMIEMCRQGGTLYLPSLLAGLLDSSAQPGIAHIHMQALTENRRFIEALGLKPVIMIRNIADMLASFLDMLDADPITGDVGLQCEIPKNFRALDRVTKLNFVIDVIAPWYATYFASWKRVVDDAPGMVCVLRYRDLRANPADTLSRALSHAGSATSRFESLKAVEQMRSRMDSYRYNMGVSGRGVDYFTTAQLARLHKMLSYHPQLSDWAADLLGESMQANAKERIAI